MLSISGGAPPQWRATPLVQDNGLLDRVQIFLPAAGGELALQDMSANSLLMSADARAENVDLDRS